MTDDDLRLLEAAGATEVEAAAGYVLIERGQPGAGIYVILEGTVVVEAPEGDIELGPRTVIGERALLAEHGRRAARVRATTPVRLLAVDRVEFEQLRSEDPALAQRLVDAGV